MDPSSYTQGVERGAAGLAEQLWFAGWAEAQIQAWEAEQLARFGHLPESWYGHIDDRMGAACWGRWVIQCVICHVAWYGHEPQWVYELDGHVSWERRGQRKGVKARRCTMCREQVRGVSESAREGGGGPPA